MNIDQAFPSKYLKASDLPEEGSTAYVIEDVRVEEIGREKQPKPVIYFDDEDKGFVANKTNCNTIAKLTGSRDTEGWIGKTIRLYRTEVEFGGEMVESIRVSIKPSKSAAPLKPVQPKEDIEELPDIPF